MTREETEKRIKVMQAFVDGKDVEVLNTDKWELVSNPSWSPNTKYRIKPESKYRPFESAQECIEEMKRHEPFGWVKGYKCFYNIVSVSNIDVSMANVSGDIVTLDFIEVMEDNTFADGTPFGVKIEEDYNGIK